MKIYCEDAAVVLAVYGDVLSDSASYYPRWAVSHDYVGPLVDLLLGDAYDVRDMCYETHTRTAKFSSRRVKR